MPIFCPPHLSDVATVLHAKSVNLQIGTDDVTGANRSHGWIEAQANQTSPRLQGSHAKQVNKTLVHYREMCMQKSANATQKSRKVVT